MNDPAASCRVSKTKGYSPSASCWGIIKLKGMSLIIGARFCNGILLASDPFVFDNDGEMPLKTISFNKFYISSRLSCALIGVGSGWVFQKFCNWMDSFHMAEINMEDWLPEKWKELNMKWKDQRDRETTRISGRTLRPISDSLFIMARIFSSELIYIVQSDGSISKSTTFVISGSGGYLVDQFLRSSGRIFKSSDGLDECFDLVRCCYEAASADLYVIGYPLIILVKSDRIIDMSKSCAQIWQECSQRYYDQLRKKVLTAQ